MIAENPKLLLINTFDLEPWWSTVPPCVPISDWPNLQDKSLNSLNLFLNLCDEYNVKCTFFVLGWYAKTFPERVRNLVERGHEVGCHSLFHEDVALQSSYEFKKSTEIAKKLIEDATGKEVISYRAPSFSVPKTDLNIFFEDLVSLGFKIDSSICTSTRLYGGLKNIGNFVRPEMISDAFNVDLFEIPVTGVKFYGKEFQLLGGGYLRLAPMELIKSKIKSVNYQVLYLHPHDLDDTNPRIPNGSLLTWMRRNFKVGRLEDKIRFLFDNCEVCNCLDLYKKSI